MLLEFQSDARSVRWGMFVVSRRTKARLHVEETRQ